MAARQDALAPLIYSDLPLRESSKDIRLVDLLPGREGDNELRVTIRVVATEPGAPYYEALSYTCGSMSEGRIVIVNGQHRVTVYDNLFRALRAMRRRTKVRTMWIDTLCIDQSNLEERAEQVARMGQIYSSAHCVNVWLGEPSDGTNSKDVPRLSFLRRANWLFSKPFSTQPSSIQSRLERRLAFAALRNEHVILEEAMQSTESPWYTRAWTVQEFAVSRRAYLWVGRKRIKNPRERVLTLDYGFADSDEFPHLSALSQRLIFATNHELISQFMRTDFSTLIQVTDSSKASDSRDMVYSLLSLMTPPVASLIGVDYALSTATVYAKATFAYMKVNLDFGVFCFAHTIGRRVEGLPSWAVDFTVSPHGGGGLYTRMETIDLTFSQHVRAGLDTNSNGDRMVEDWRAQQRPLYEHERESQDMLSLASDHPLLKFAGRTNSTVDTVVDFFGEPSERSYLLDPSEADLYVVPRRLIRDACNRLRSIRSKPSFKEADVEFVDNLIYNVNSTLSRDEIEGGLEPDVVIKTMVSTWIRLRPDFLGARKDKDMDRQVRHAILTITGYYNGRSVERPCLFTTECGAVGLASRDVIAGDRLVCVPNFGRMIVLRPVSLSGHYTLRGLAFVYGLDAAEVRLQAGMKVEELEPFRVE